MGRQRHVRALICESIEIRRHVRDKIDPCGTLFRDEREDSTMVAGRDIDNLSGPVDVYPLPEMRFCGISQTLGGAELHPVASVTMTAITPSRVGLRMINNYHCVEQRQIWSAAERRLSVYACLDRKVMIWVGRCQSVGLSQPFLKVGLHPT